MNTVNMKPVRHRVRPTIQTSPHTCGFCAVNSVYRFYGLDPKALAVRELLGTDHILPCNTPYRDKLEARMGGTDHGFAGTAPMDLFAVLCRHGFEVGVATAGYHRYRDWMHDHLVNGDLAIALMYSVLHWVIVCGMDEKGVWITDSYFTDDDLHETGRESRLYRLTHDEFAREEHGVLLVSRNDADAGKPLRRRMRHRDYFREYARGLSFCAEAFGKNIPRMLHAGCQRITKNHEAA